MKNPLFKRLPYILKDEIAKYLIIFLFMAGSIGLISGFLLADGSMIKAYNDSFDKYNIEDGHFRLNDSLSKENKKTLDLKIRVMTCAAWAKAVETVNKKLDGV